MAKAKLELLVRQAGYTRIAFRCSSYHRNSALHPVITRVERLLRFDPDDTPERKLDKLEKILRTYSLPLDEVVPLFAGLLSVPLGERYPAPTLTPQQQKQQTLDTLVAWMMEEAERQPVLVVWEDLHWADPSTLEMLDLVLEQTPTVPMLHVLTFRPEFTPPWPTRSHMTPITLNRLERPQVEALIRHLAGAKPLPVEVIEHIVAKTDGVPLYVEELTKMLLESDLLHEDVDCYTLTGPLAQAAIPATLHDSLMARLDRLPTVREVAQLGAVLGREFAYEMLAALAVVEEPTLQAGLSQLVDTELLYQRGRPPRARYIFRHVLIRDAAYQSLLRRTRQAYHQQVAQLLERRFPEVVEMQPELVAHHYTEAGCHEQAISYWQQAGERAAQRSAHVEAIHHLEQGLVVLKTLPATSEHIQQELTLQVALGVSLMASKGHTAPEVERVYARARELCQQVGETPQLFPVLFGLWRFYLLGSEKHTVRELAEQLMHLGNTTQDPALLLEAHRALGATLLWFFGEFAPALAHLERSVTLYDPQQHRSHAFLYGIDPQVYAGACAGIVRWFLGYPDQALETIQDALTSARTLSHPFSLAFALGMAAWLSQYRREAQATHEQAEVLMTLAQKHGFPFWEAYGMLMRGWALAAQGQDEEGITQIHQGLRAYQATGTRHYRPYFLALQAEAYRKAGQTDAGLHTTAAVLALVDKTGECWWEAEMHRLKGVLLLALSLENHAEAATCFHQALDIARRQEAKSLELRATMSLSRLWQQQGKRAEARQLLAEVYGWFTEGFDTADLQEARVLLDELAQ